MEVAPAQQDAGFEILERDLDIPEPGNDDNMPDEGYVSRNSFSTGTTHIVYKLPEIKTDVNGTDQQGPLNDIMAANTLSPLTDLQSLRSNSIILFKFDGDDAEQQRVWNLLEQSCRLIGMTKNVEPSLVTTLVLRIRGRKLDIPNLELQGIWTVALRGQRENSSNIRVSIFQAVMCLGKIRKYNFGIFTIREHTAETVITGWEPKSLAEVDWQVTVAKSTSAKKRTSHEAIVAAIGDRYIQRRRTQLDVPNAVKQPAE
eukprot:TRINITY_DN47984_c0_g1_i1.p1 TRINITY_DN47984_c0_g1~~TRINITY_DN47984_c0_g1_i1.p1  ORF type:complete len:258 (-),score=38.64 TRINITY_DN47984_c0_g1_i1:201-974(-)